MSVGLGKLKVIERTETMEQELIFRTTEVIKNLQANRDFSNSEAYAYAFGWAWAMLTDADRLKLIEISGREQN